MIGGMAAALAVLCLLAALALVVAERREARSAKVACKVVASTAFVALALACGAPGTIYGRVLLLAQALSWVGDLLLLSARDRVFLLGIGAFLLAHVAYAVAFATAPLAASWLALGACLMAATAVVTLRWLWPHLRSFYRVAVPAYVVALAVMATLAVGATAQRPLVALGALAFAASDISVARDRFVAPGFVNRAWGLPLYYAAQVLLALSVVA
jgi:uncharacterized membrane protein YhhN